MKTLKLAVIGKDVSKSASPQMHKFIAENMGFKVEYEKLSIPQEQFESSVENLFNEFDGFNVTIPYKLSIIPHLNNVCGDASVYSAVNTVLTSDKSGYNTDGLGFALMLENAGVKVNGKSVLLLGAGGAGRSVAKKLADGGASVFVYDKLIQNAQAVAKEFSAVALEEIENKSYDIIINATGIGMHKTEGISPVGERLLSLCGVAVDLIYEPKESKFLQIAHSLGKQTVNGEAMLFYQAYYAECIYHGIQPNSLNAKQLFERYTEEI